MDFFPGPYTPFPVSGERSETPPPDFDPSHPFTGVELIVSGLPFTSISSASKHLSQVVQDIVNNGTPMPELQIVSPSTRQPLDFVYVSLSGTLKENPRPDVLENVRTRLDSAGGLEARWKVSSGRSDKTRQAYFEIEESLNPLHLKTRFDNILRQNHMTSSLPTSLMIQTGSFIISSTARPSQTSPTTLFALIIAPTLLVGLGTYNPFTASK